MYMPTGRAELLYFPLTFQFRLDRLAFSKAEEAKAAMYFVLERCGALSKEAAGPMIIDYVVKAKLVPLRFLGNIVTLHQSVEFTCPSSITYLLDALKQLGS